MTNVLNLGGKDTRCVEAGDRTKLTSCSGAMTPSVLSSNSFIFWSSYRAMRLEPFHFASSEEGYVL